jgi:hypothetical protein
MHKEIYAMKRQSGFGLLEVLGALAVGTIIFAGYARMAGDAQKQMRDTVTAQHLKQVSDAATRYIQDNWATIEATATATVPAVITTAMLTATGYLSSTFSGTNPYGQTLQVEVLEPSAGNLQAVVLSMGGTTIPQAQAPRIAAKVGAGGGYTPSASPTTAQGAFGGWSMPLTYNTKPGAGHLAGLLYFSNGQLIPDYLRRHSVPGHPEVNQMFTTLDMNGQNLSNANQVNGTTVTASQTVTAGAGNVQLSNQAGEGGLIKTIGANGQVAWFENLNGTLRTINSPWTAATWSVDQSGNTSNPGQASSGSVRTQIVYDSNNTGYYVDPNGISRTNYTIQDNNYTYGATQADIYYDRWNNGYYMQPRGINRLNYVAADNQVTYGNNAANTFQVNGVAAAGGGCSPNGLVARDAAGALLSCKSGVWTAAAAQPSGGFQTYRTTGVCIWANPRTGGCSCPAPTIPILSGQGYLWDQWDRVHWMCG